MFSNSSDTIIGRQEDVRWQMNYIQHQGVGSDASFYDNTEDPAADGEPLPRPLSAERLSLDDEIKRFEAQFAQQAREMNQQQQAPPALASAPQGPSVNFAEEALLYGSDQSEEEVLFMWYNREELNEFKSERKEVVKALKRANFNLSAVEATGRYCLRGYEPYFSMEVNKAMKYARTLVLSIVLQEQQRQRVEGIYYDASAMHQAIAPASEWARDNALQLGRNDEVEAFDEYAGFFHDDEESESRDCYNDSSSDSLDYSNNNICTNSSVVTAATSSSHFSQDDDCRSMVSHPHGNDSLAYYAAHSSTNTNNLETILEQDPAATLLGKKRKDVVEQPPFASRPHVQPQQHDQEETDEIAERLDSALKLVAALKATGSMRR